jgi:hypothetical protein
MFQITNDGRCNVVMGIVKKVLAIFEVEGKRGANLESCYEHLNSISSSSVEPDHVFSGYGRRAPKWCSG